MRRWLLLASLVLLVPILVGWVVRPKSASTTGPLGGVWTYRATQPDGRTEQWTWFFGRKGKGLVRHQVDEIAWTKSFLFRTDGAKLTVTFDKTNAVRSSHFVVDDRHLSLATDPLDGRRRTLSKRAADRLYPHVYGTYSAWSDDGSFRMLQMLSPRVGGKGRGWYHQGDKHEWRTEPFRYSADRMGIWLRFDHRPLQERIESFWQVGTRALYRMDGGEDRCAYVHTRAQFSRWLEDAPLPYKRPVNHRKRAAPHDEACRLRAEHAKALGYQP